MFLATRSATLLLSASIWVASVETLHSFEINTPRQYAKYWNAGRTSNSVNPCLFSSIKAPSEEKVNYIYPSGFDLLWAGGYLGLQQYLTWKSSGISDNELINNIAMTIGFPPAYTFNDSATPPADYATAPNYRTPGNWNLYVFDGCKRAKRRNSPRVPTPAFWLNRLRSVYRVQISQVAYNTLTAKYWDVQEYTGCSNVACMAATDFGNGNDCGCNQDFLSAVNKFMPYSPYGSSSTKRAKNEEDSTLNCYRQLSNNPDASELRAALSVCNDVGFWNTGIGMSWNFAGIATISGAPINASEVTTSPFDGATLPEFVFDNQRIQKLKAVKVSVGVSNGAPPPF